MVDSWIYLSPEAPCQDTRSACRGDATGKRDCFSVCLSLASAQNILGVVRGAGDRSPPMWRRQIKEICWVIISPVGATRVLCLSRSSFFIWRELHAARNKKADSIRRFVLAFASVMTVQKEHSNRNVDGEVGSVWGQYLWLMPFSTQRRSLVWGPW